MWSFNKPQPTYSVNTHHDYMTPSARKHNTVTPLWEKCISKLPERIEPIEIIDKFIKEVSKLLDKTYYNVNSFMNYVLT